MNLPRAVDIKEAPPAYKPHVAFKFTCDRPEPVLANDSDFKQNSPHVTARLFCCSAPGASEVLTALHAQVVAALHPRHRLLL